MVNSTFSGGGGGGGGVNCLFPIETHITCDFPGGVRTPCPHSGSALDYTEGIQPKVGLCPIRLHVFVTSL